MQKNKQKNPQQPPTLTDSRLKNKMPALCTELVGAIACMIVYFSLF